MDNRGDDRDYGDDGGRGGGRETRSPSSSAFFTCPEEDDGPGTVNEREQEEKSESRGANNDGDDACGGFGGAGGDSSYSSSSYDGSSHGSGNCSDHEEEDEELNRHSLAEMCLSPPKNVRKIKRDKSKLRSTKSGKSNRSKSSKSKTKQQQQQQRPKLVNSAERLGGDESSSMLEASSLSDRLNEISERRELEEQLMRAGNKNVTTNNVVFNSSSSTSAPPTAVIQTNTPSTLTSTFASLLRPSGGADNNSSSPTTTTTGKSVTYRRNPNDHVDPFDRAETQKRILNLLQLALKSNNTNTTNPTLLKKQKQSNLFSSFLAAAPSVIPPTKSTSMPTASICSHNRQQDSVDGNNVTTPSVCSLCSSTGGGTIMDELTHRRFISTCIWKEIYDYFEHYAARARSMAEIDARLSVVRAKIKFKIELIQSTSFGFIKAEMNRELAACIRTPIEYSTLYERKPYIDQLCYLYWLVEDLINEIGKIESLYPSVEALKADQPAYADRAFQSTIKTLTLWYKLISQLMNKSDIMGRFLGFAKNNEYKEHWTWFEQRLNYSKAEYETVQKWLNENVAAEELDQTPITGGGGVSVSDVFSSELCSGRESNATLRAAPSPTIEVTKPSSSNLAELGKIDRQISFALRPTSSNVNLLYNSFGSNSGDLSLGGKPSSKNTSLASNVSSMDTSLNLVESSQQQPQPTLNPEQLAVELLKQTSSTADSTSSEHLKSAKIYHLNSFIASRSSSANTAAGSLSPISPSIYRSLIAMNELDAATSGTVTETDAVTKALTLTKENEENHEENNKVIFTINPTGNEMPNKTKSPSKQNSLDDHAHNQSSHQPHHHSQHHFHYPLAPPGSGSLAHRHQHHTNPYGGGHAQHYGVGQNPNKIREKILSEFLRKRLRKCGLTQTFKEIRQVLLDTLFNALQALQIDRCERYTLTGCDDHFYYHLMPLHHKCKEFIAKYTLDEETIQYGVKCDTYKRLDLPTFRPLYLHLCSVLLELMHLCIRMQIENNRALTSSTSSSQSSMGGGGSGMTPPNSLSSSMAHKLGTGRHERFKFSLLSIEVLTTECRECIEQAIIVRQLYYHMIYSVFDRSEMDVQTLLEHDLLRFDDDLKEIINIYLNFITNWVQDLVKQSDLSKALWVLTDEWAFCKNNLYYVTASEDIYAKRFCTMSTYINGSIQSYLSYIDSTYKQPLMEYISRVEITQDIDEYDTSGHSLMLEQQQQQPPTEANAKTDGLDAEPDDGDDDQDEYDEEEEEREEENINLKCNEFKEEINRMKKYSMKALGFCSKLINDLELAARYEVKSSIQELLDELKQSGHVLINFTNPELNSSSFSTTPESSTSSFDHLVYSNTTETAAVQTTGGGGSYGSQFMIFVPQEFYKEKLQIIRLLFIISEKDEFDSSMSDDEKTAQQECLPSSGADQFLNCSLDSSHIYKIFNETVFGNSKTFSYNQQQQQRQKSPGLSTVRRLSSSNSFVEIGNDSQAKSYLSKLSRLANLGRIDDNPATGTTITSTNLSMHNHPSQSSASSQEPVTAFIISPNTHTKPNGYLLYLQLPKQLASQHQHTSSSYKWTGPTTSLYASIPVRNSLYKHKSTMACHSPKLILVTPKQSILNEKRIEIKQKLKGTISLIKEKTSFHPNIEYAIDELVESILTLRKEAIEYIRSIERDLKIDRVGYNEAVIDQRYLSELWRVSYNFGIELQNECMKFMTQDKAELFAAGLADFSVTWCEYIVSKTERGKGRTMRPWAANKGIQLMQEAVAHSVHLKDEDFMRLIESVKKCITHVIGDRNSTSSTSSSTSSNPPSAGLLMNNNHHMYYHSGSLSSPLHHYHHLSGSGMKSSYSIGESIRATAATVGGADESSSPHLAESRTITNMHDSNNASATEFQRSTSLTSQKRNGSTRMSGSGLDNGKKSAPPRQRFSDHCLEADRKREEVLLSKRYIGKILDPKTNSNNSPHIFTTTEVSFRWQLGLLIGEGQFGKVYSCVNLDTGEPMALKKIQFRSNDVVHVKSIADEINNMQGIQHENLVKIYGAELHRKEILIFMEFCGDQSTLNRISRDASGLPEKIVRDYTKSLLKAVECLHENNIMHRDIKGANIFLKPIDPYHPEKTILKLGDFGCSIKFKDPVDPSNKERATGFMGTFAFMAPEVMSSGNGSMDSKYDMLADIWSVGCVVIEMFTGKHPWHPLTDEKILYTVFIEGKMKKPPYPPGISEEAQHFLDCCLAFESKNRHTADRLLDNSFVKVPEDHKYFSIS